MSPAPQYDQNQEGAGDRSRKPTKKAPISNHDAIESAQELTTPSTKRNDANELLSCCTAVQREQVPDWHERFITFSEITDEYAAGLQVNGLRSALALRSALWNGERTKRIDGIPNCPYKRFQETFSSPEKYSVPRFIFKDGQFLFAEEPRALSVISCLGSLDRLSDELASNLGLLNLSEFKRNPIGRLTAKAAPEVWLTVKMIYDAAETLETNNFRVMIIRAPSAEVSARYLRAKAPSQDLIGCVLYSREHEGGNAKVDAQFALAKSGDPYRKLLMQFYVSVYSAHRKTLHEGRLHLDEIAGIARIRQELKAQGHKLTNQWKTGLDETQKNSLRGETTALAARATNVFMACVNRHKVLAREKFGKTIPFEDATGRDNPLAVCTRWVAGMERLEKRLKEMRSKGSYNQRDEMALSERIETQKGAMQQIRSVVIGASKLVEKGTYPFLSDKPLCPRSPEKESTVLKAQVDGFLKQHSIEGHLASLADQPYLPIREKMEQLMGVLEAALLERSKNNTTDALIKLHVVGKIAAVLEKFETIKREIALTPLLPLSQAQKLIAQLQEFLRAREIFPDVIVPAYSSPFKAMTNTIGSIRRRIDSLLSSSPGEEEHLKIIQRFKKYLDKFDIRSELRKLP